MFFIWIHWMIDASCESPFDVYKLPDSLFTIWDYAKHPVCWKHLNWLRSIRGDVRVQPFPKTQPKKWVTVYDIAYFW